MTARNNQYVNLYSYFQLQGWQANVDLKLILSIHFVLQYILKYASKSELWSTTFSDILNQILSKNQPKDLFLILVQKLLLYNITEWDISTQEICHILFSLSFYHSSHQFVFLNFNKKTLRWICNIRKNNESFNININNIGQTEKLSLKTYWKWPIKLKDFSLYQL